LRHKVASVGMTVPVDAHERTRDYLTEDEFLTLLEGTKGSRYRWRDTAMLMLTFYHGLRASEVCNLIQASDDYASFLRYPLVRCLTRGGGQRCGRFG
jgi:site-specific recombinase XerD